MNFEDKNLQRFLAVGLLVFVILLIALLVILPVFNQLADFNEQKNSLAFRLQQYQRILAKKEAVLQNRELIEEQRNNQNYFNTQDTDALATAEMQAFIKQAVVDAGGVLTSTQALPVVKGEKFSKITVSVRVSGNSEMLRDVLYKLETATPFIIINQIDIRPLRGHVNPNTNKVEPSNELNVNFQAVSFMPKKSTSP